MKKVALIIAIIFTQFINSVTCLGQNTTILNNIASIYLPDNAEKINKEQGIAHIKRMFKTNNTRNDSILMESFYMGTPKHAYKVGDILVSLFSDNHAVPGDHLLKTKKSFDELFSANKTYTSVIKNNSTLISNFVSNETNYYYFFVYNPNFTKAVTGRMAFESEDTKKAENLLDRVIKSISFIE